MYRNFLVFNFSFFLRKIMKSEYKAVCYINPFLAFFSVSLLKVSPIMAINMLRNTIWVKKVAKQKYSHYTFLKSDSPTNLVKKSPNPNR